MTSNVATNSILFTGIKNNYGYETKFMIYIDPLKKESYITDYYYDKKRLDAHVNPRDAQIIIAEVIYNYHFKIEGTEILLIAVEKSSVLDNIINYIFCRGKNNFLLGTNKMEV